jgi:beta-N-acetylhexosaminidase
MTSPIHRSVFFALFSSCSILFSCAVREKPPVPDPADLEAAALAEKIVSGMSDRELAAQVLLTGVDGAADLGRRSAELLSRLPVGGAMLFKYNLGAGPGAARGLSGAIRASAGGGVPPFVAVDHEGGPVHRFGPDATRLPSAAEFGRLGAERIGEVVEEAAFRSGRELRALGSP